MNSIEYRVQPGDTLSAIARRHHVAEEALSRLNGLNSINRLRAGQTLRIARTNVHAPSQSPQPQTYRVRVGGPPSSAPNLLAKVKHEAPAPFDLLAKQELLSVDDHFWRGPKPLAMPYLGHPHTFKVEMKRCFGDDIPDKAFKAVFSDLKSGRFPGPKYQFSKDFSADTVACYAKGVITLSEPLVRQAQLDPEKQFTLFLGLVHEFGHHLDFVLRTRYSTVGGSAPGEEGHRFLSVFVRFNGSLSTNFNFATFHWGARTSKGMNGSAMMKTVYSVKAGAFDAEARAKHLLFTVDELEDRGKVILNGQQITVDFFKIRGAGAVHEDITKAAAATAKVDYGTQLDEGCAWPDVPCAGNGTETCYSKTWKDMDTPGTLAHRSHFGDLQYWHSMAPTGGLTNQQVVEKIIAQAKVWYELGVAERNAFHIGKLLHMVQDSFSRSHVIRVDKDEPPTRANALRYTVKKGDTVESIAAEHQLTRQQLAEFNWGSAPPPVINKYGTGMILIPQPRLRNQIISFQGYADQDEKKHGEADKVTGGSWRTIPGATDALNASVEVLTHYAKRSDFASLEFYLRKTVYPLAPKAAEAIAGGSAPPYSK